VGAAPRPATSVKPTQLYTGERLFSGTLDGISALPLISVHANR
jgi:hypothetical protein